MGGMRNIAALLIILCMGSSANLRSQQTTTAPLPKDPTALMDLVREKNGLTGPDVQPWHIRGTYTFYDQKGQPERTGTYEEWWAGSGKYKRSFTEPQFNQTDYADGTHLYRDGDQQWPESKEMLLRSLLVSPTPNAAILKNFNLHVNPITAGATKLNCVELLYQLRDNLKVIGDYFPTYCIASDLPLLRLSSLNTSQRIFYNKIVLFQNHYVAKEIHGTYDGKPWIDFTIDAIEGFKDIPSAFPAPPTTAQVIDLNTISLHNSKNVSSFYPTNLKKMAPYYPEMAKANRITGTVHIRGTVTSDGHLSNTVIVDGPPALQKAATDAVSQWLYEPFDVLDRPTPVEVELNIIFSLGN